MGRFDGYAAGTAKATAGRTQRREQRRGAPAGWAWLAASGLLACAGLSASGCSGFMNRFTVNSTAPVLKIGMVALDTESDVQFARESAPASLKTVETFLVTSPDNPDLLEVLAQGYVQYAFGFLEDDLEAMGDRDEAASKRVTARATMFYERGLEYGVRLAALSDKRFPAAMKGDTAGMIKLLSSGRFKSAATAPGIYWAGLALASTINLNKDDVDRIGDLGKATALLEHAHSIAPAYGLWGASMALGLVYGSQGKAMGGDPERSKKMFDEVLGKTGGKFLLAKVLYARIYATTTQDRALYESTLREVLNTPATVMPEQRLANELALVKAARYLAQADDLFLPPEPAGTSK